MDNFYQHLFTSRPNFKLSRIVEGKGNMTALEKQVKVREMLFRNCGYGNGCSDCEFFKPEDETDGDFFCAIRDSNKLIPYDDEWDMASAMISD